MKKIICCIVLSILLVLCFTSCGKNTYDEISNENSIEGIDFSALGCEPYESTFYDDALWVTKTESDYSKSITYFGCIDKDSNIIVPFTDKFAEVQSFSDDRAWVKFNDERKNMNAANWGIIDKSGNIIRKFDVVFKGQHTKFSEGYCLAEGTAELAPPLYVVHKNGDLIQIDRDAVPQGSPFNISTINVFKDGYVLCEDETYDHHLYYIKTDGSLLILKENGRSPLADFKNLNIYHATDFDDGQARVDFKGADGLHYSVHIDGNGNMIDTPTPIEHMNY